MTPLLSIAKAEYMAGRDWHSQRIYFCGEPKKMARVFTFFAPYFLSAYDVFFVEAKIGAAYVTAISDVGIRIESFNGMYAEWVLFNRKAIREWKLIPQK